MTTARKPYYRSTAFFLEPTVHTVSRIFISHSSKDRTFVEQHIVDPLRAINQEPWYSAEAIQGADHWERSILGGLAASKWFLLAMSRHSAASEYVKDEVAWAVEERPKNIVPLLIEECNMRDFHLRIPRIQHIDFRDDPATAFSKVKGVLSASEQADPAKAILLRQPEKKNAHDFWSALSEGGLQIVLGRFSQFQHFEKSGLLGVGDAAAMLELRSHLEAILIHKTAVTFADRLAGESLRTNLVLLGGPDANAITARLLPTMKTSYQFRFQPRNQIQVLDALNGQLYSPKPNSDYGVIFRGVNPFNSAKTAIIVAGAYGFGTWAGVRHLISDEFATSDTVRRELEIECLVATDVAWEMPHNVKRIGLRASNVQGIEAAAEPALPHKESRLLGLFRWRK